MDLILEILLVPEVVADRTQSWFHCPEKWDFHTVMLKSPSGASPCCEHPGIHLFMSIHIYQHTFLEALAEQ